MEKFIVGILIIICLIVLSSCDGTSKEAIKEEFYPGLSKESVEKEEEEESVKSEQNEKEEKKFDFTPLSKDEKVVYMTFDDGPCSSTPELLKVLKELNVKATFFVTRQFGTGEQAAEWLRQIKEEGHEIAVHTYSHQYSQIYSSSEEFWADYNKMDDFIWEATGERSKIYRFPGGSNTSYNESIRTELIRKLNDKGIVYYDWNAYDGDNDKFTQKEMIEKTVTECSYKSKSILLMHNTPNTGDVMNALPTIVQQLQSKGYRFDALDERVKPIQFIDYEDYMNDVNNQVNYTYFEGNEDGKTIVIDAGHGGNDPGAASGEVYEKNITIGIAQKLK